MSQIVKIKKATYIMSSDQDAAKLGDVDVFISILGSVNWTEESRLSVLLLSIYTICILLTVISWTRTYLMWGIFTFLCIAVYSAQWLNEVAARNFKLISEKHQFFDSAGLFISIVYSFPLIITLLVLLLRMLYLTATEMIKVKKVKLQATAKKTD